MFIWVLKTTISQVTLYHTTVLNQESLYEKYL